MRRPKWLSGWGKGKNPFEGSLIIDTPDIKVVEASFNNKLVLFAVGTLPRHETVVSGEKSAAAIEEKHKTDLEWRVFYDSTALPDFMPIDKAKDFMAGTVAVSSGTASVYDAGTVYIASGNRPSKGNAPVLLDYEMAKKIEEAKKIVRI
jgi:hypothetical protein